MKLLTRSGVLDSLEKIDSKIIEDPSLMTCEKTIRKLKELEQLELMYSEIPRDCTNEQLLAFMTVQCLIFNWDEEKLMRQFDKEAATIIALFLSIAKSYGDDLPPSALLAGLHGILAA